MIKSYTISQDVHDDRKFTNQGCAEQIWHSKCAKLFTSVISKLFFWKCFQYVTIHFKLMLFICFVYISGCLTVHIFSGLVPNYTMQNVGETEAQSVKRISFNFFPCLEWYIFCQWNSLAINSVRRMCAVNKLLNSVATNICYFGFWNISRPLFWIRWRHMVAQWMNYYLLIITVLASGGAVKKKSQ